MLVTVNVTYPLPLYDVEPLNPVPDVFSVRVPNVPPNYTPDIVLFANIVFDTVPESPVVITVPLVAGNVMVVVPAAYTGTSVTVPDVEPGI